MLMSCHEEVSAHHVTYTNFAEEFFVQGNAGQLDNIGFGSDSTTVTTTTCRQG